MTTEDAEKPRPSLWDGLVDLFVYAPIGLTLDAQDLAPDLARRGRQHTAAARRIGEFAVKAGMRRLDEIVTSIDPSGSVGVRPSRADETPVPEDASTSSASELHGVDSPGPHSVAATETHSSGTADPVSSVAADPPAAAADLAIVDYDLLAASQVVKRLDALDAVQLDTIRRHEEAGRGRRTILHKIARLQDDRQP